MDKKLRKTIKKLSLNENFKEKGFSLIELILVLAISSFIIVAFLKFQTNQAQLQRAEKGAEQLVLIGKALSSYINRDVGSLAANVPSGSTVTLTGNVLRGGNETVGGNLYYGYPILPANFTMQSVFGPNYVLQITNNAGVMEGLVITDNPICEQANVACSSSNPIKYEWIGAAMKAIGPVSGMTYNSTNTMTGYNTGWQETSTRFNTINKAGLLGYRVFGSSAAPFDNIYLRLDGTSVMRGNLDMGNYTIRNAASINANDWVRTDSLLANLVRTGNLYVTQNIESMNASFANNAFVGNDFWASRDAGVGRNLWVANDTTLRNNLWVGNDAEVTRDLLVGRNMGVDQDAMIGRDSFTGRNALVTNNLSALQLRTRDVLFGGGYEGNPSAAGPAKASARQIPAGYYLSDMIPRYSSRGFQYIYSGQTVTKPQCPGGNINARVEVIPQTVTQQGRVMGTFAFTGNYPNYTLNQNQYSHGAFSISVTDNGTSWTPNILVSTYNGALLNSTSQVALVHTYCDLNF